MIHTEVFVSCANGLEAYGDVENAVNQYLERHPEAKYLNSHTNLRATPDDSEFALTLIVELPDIAPLTQDSSQTQSLDDLQLDRMGDDSLAWKEIRATVRACPQIHLQDRRAFGSTGWNVIVPGGFFGETAHSTEELLSMVKHLQSRL